jgi:hypothetical protein
MQMKDYMFLFRGGDAAMAQESPDAMQAHMQKWFAWIEKLQKKGVYVSGEPLEPGGKAVRNRGRQIIDGPFAEGKEVVGGYFVIKARNIDEASEIAKECPDFEFDNATVEVRPIMQIDM